MPLVTPVDEDALVTPVDEDALASITAHGLRNDLAGAGVWDVALVPLEVVDSPRQPVALPEKVRVQVNRRHG